MGVDTIIALDPRTRVSDAADVIGILLGCTTVKMPLHPRPESGNEWGAQDPVDNLNPPVVDDSWYTFVFGVTVTNVETLPECVRINVKPEFGEPRTFLWHFEFGIGGNEARKGMLPRSYPINIAIGRKLVEVFGGELWYSDTAGGKVNPDFRADPPDPHTPEDGAPWQAWQERLYEVQPVVVTREDHAGAAYKDR